MISLDNMFSEEARILILSKELGKEAATQIEGLFRRFPIVWLEKEKYGNYNHHYLEGVYVKQGFLQSMAYCLFKESANEKELKIALNDVIKRIRPKLFKLMNNKLPYINLELLLPEVLKNISRSDNQKILFHLAIIDYWALQENKKIKVDEYIYEIISRDLLSKAKYIEEGYQNYGYVRWIYDKINGENDRFLNEHYMKCIQEKTGMPLSEYINEIWMALYNYDPADSLIPFEVYMLYKVCWDDNLIAPSPVPPFNQNDYLEILSRIVHCITSLISRFKDDERDDLIEIVMLNAIDLVDNLLPYTLIIYYIVQLRHKDRKDFFSLPHIQDMVTNQELNNIISKLKNKIKEEQQVSRAALNENNTLEYNLRKSFQTALDERDNLYCQLQKKFDKLKRINDDLATENTKLKNKNNQLVELLNNINEDEEINETIEKRIRVLEQTKILIIGGHPSTVKRLKKYLPNCTYYECEQSFPDIRFKNLHYGIILKRWVNHSMIYKVQKVLPTLELIDLGSTNINRILHDLLNTLN